MRLVLVALLACTALIAQKYTGTLPPKPDLPYLVHANNLVPTEAGEAREEGKKDDIIYVIAGAASPVKTPLASPIFLLQADKLQPEKFELYRLEVKNGRREVTFSRKKRKTARPIRLSIHPLGESVYRLEVDETLENGEYSISPGGSNQVFCFAVF
ncbi:MAG: hypothetical protein HYX25_04670 [Candidatus Solibacter usitatus]|nr:hypothetical protein [Candidatus Solibacter usitatus]